MDKIGEIFAREIMDTIFTEPWPLRMMGPERRAQWEADRRREACEAFCPEI